MQSVAVIVLLAVFCIACDPADPQCHKHKNYVNFCNPANPQCRNAKNAWRQKEKEAKILRLKSQEAIPTGLDDPRADMHYKKLQGLISPHGLGTLRIDAIWNHSPTIWNGQKEVQDLVTLSNLTIPFPFELRRDNKTGELRIKVDEYLILTKHKDYISRPGDWRNGTTELFEGSEWAFLYSLWINLGLGSGLEISSLQIVTPPSVAPFVAPSVAPPTPPTKNPCRQRCFFYYPHKCVYCCPGDVPSITNPGTYIEVCRPVTRSIAPTAPTVTRSIKASVTRSVAPTVTTDKPFVSSANFLVIGVASVMPFFLTFF